MKIPPLTVDHSFGTPYLESGPGEVVFEMWTHNPKAWADEAALRINLHDELVAALRELNRWCCRPGDDGKGDDGYDAARDMVHAVLKKLEGASHA